MLPENPGQWDFYEQEKYETRVTTKDQPLYIFNAAVDRDYIVGSWKRGNQLVPGPKSWRSRIPDKAGKVV
jgi:hypothetical protein